MVQIYKPFATHTWPATCQQLRWVPGTNHLGKTIICRDLALGIRKAAFHVWHASPGAVQAAGIVHALIALRANRWTTPLRTAKLQQPAPRIPCQGCLQQVQTERQWHNPNCWARTECIRHAATRDLCL